MSLLKSVEQTAFYTIPLQKPTGIQSLRPLLFYLPELFDFLNFEAFLYGSWCKMLSPYLSDILGLLGRTDFYILIFFAYPGNCYCISSLSPDEDTRLLLCINEIPLSCIPVSVIPYTSERQDVIYFHALPV